VNAQHLPTVGFEAGVGVLGEAEIGGTVEGDEIVIVKEDELAESEGAGEGSGFMGDAFHQVAVAADAVGMVVDDLEAGLIVDGGEVLFRDGQAYRHREALAEGAGSDFDTVGEMGFRMAGGLGVVLAEALEVVEGELVAGEKETSIKKRGGVTVGEDEAVTVGLFGISRVVLHELVKEQVGDG
jgi:hypothetical protein